MTTYTPELGQMIFGQPSQMYVVPAIMDAALEAIDSELCRVMWNERQEEYLSPFRNTGNTFKNDVFEVHAYSWGDEEQPYNFAWKDLRISWYKYLGRGMSANMEISPDLAAECLNDCLASIMAMEDGDIPNDD